MMNTRTNYTLSFFAIILSILALDLLANSVLDNYYASSSYDHLRNPHFRRNWPRYTAPPLRQKESNEIRVVVIANSQGSMNEYENPQNVCTAVIKRKLSALYPQKSINVLNWSVDGGAGPEMVVLAAQATLHDPDLVILSSYSGNFHTWHLTERPFQKTATDIVQLSYRPAIRKLLPNCFIASVGAFEARSFFNSVSGLARMRDIMFPDKNNWSARHGLPSSTHKFRTFSMANGGVDECLLSSFTDIITRNSPEAKILLVSMPLNKQYYKGFINSQSFHLLSTEMAADHPNIQALDLTTAMPANLFFGARHLNENGHKELAGRLIPHIQPLLEL